MGLGGSKNIVKTGFSSQFSKSGGMNFITQVYVLLLLSTSFAISLKFTRTSFALYFDRGKIFASSTQANNWDDLHSSVPFRSTVSFCAYSSLKTQISTRDYQQFLEVKREAKANFSRSGQITDLWKQLNAAIASFTPNLAAYLFACTGENQRKIPPRIHRVESLSRSPKESRSPQRLKGREGPGREVDLLPTENAKRYDLDLDLLELKLDIDTRVCGMQEDKGNSTPILEKNSTH